MKFDFGTRLVLGALASIVLMALKFTGYFPYSWIWVASPFWGVFVFSAMVLLAVFSFTLITMIAAIIFAPIIKSWNVFMYRRRNNIFR
jgi:hypothetical protein